jgi:hypothetical protein
VLPLIDYGYKLFMTFSCQFDVLERLYFYPRVPITLAGDGYAGVKLEAEIVGG